jgi:hypothetical protein
MLVFGIIFFSSFAIIIAIVLTVFIIYFKNDISALSHSIADVHLLTIDPNENMYDLVINNSFQIVKNIQGVLRASGIKITRKPDNSGFIQTSYTDNDLEYSWIEEFTDVGIYNNSIVFTNLPDAKTRVEIVRFGNGQQYKYKRFVNGKLFREYEIQPTNFYN